MCIRSTSARASSLAEAGSIEGIYYQLVTRTQPPSREVEAVLTWLREEVARPRRSAR